MHDNGHSDPVSIESYRQVRRPRPRPTLPAPSQQPAPGMSRFIADLVELAIAAHEARHHQKGQPV